jgi:uncharacterized membrane protein YoaK (UPF0700 family)
MTADTRPPEARLYFALAFIGGYGDAAGVVLAKTFTGHVTGSLILAAIAAAAHKWNALVAHLSAIFVGGAIGAVLAFQFKGVGILGVTFLLLIILISRIRQNGLLTS